MCSVCLGVIGTDQHESNGLKKGVVVDIEKTVASIQAALEEAEITSVTLLIERHAS